MKTLFVCAASALLAGCSLFDAKEPALEVTAQISSMSFHSGDQVVVTITVTNKGSKRETVNGNTCPRAFVVIDSAHARVGPPIEICDASLITKSLNPGESYVENFPWSGDGFTSQPNKGVKLAPGAYSIRGIYSDDQVENHTASFQIIN